MQSTDTRKITLRIHCMKRKYFNSWIILACRNNRALSHKALRTCKMKPQFFDTCLDRYLSNFWRYMLHYIDAETITLTFKFLQCQRGQTSEACKPYLRHIVQAKSAVIPSITFVLRSWIIIIVDRWGALAYSEKEKCTVPENIRTPLPPGNSSLASYFASIILAFKTPLLLGISNDLPWGGFGFFLELHNPGSLNRSRTYDLPITSLDALPLSYRRLLGAGPFYKLGLTV